jgi:WD40-like Beta Propeller Repeat
MRAIGSAYGRPAFPLLCLALTAACSFFDPLDQRGLSVTLLPADTTVYLEHEFQARGLMVNRYGDQYPSEHMHYEGTDPAATVTASGVVRGRKYGRAQVRVSREDFAAQAWVSVVPVGTLTVGRNPAFNPSELDVMGVDGSGVVTVVPNWPITGAPPAWLGDGTGVLYVAVDSDGAHLYVADLSGHQHRLLPTSKSEIESKARSSHDGQWVYFVRLLDPFAEFAIWRVHPDGTSLEQVTPGAGESEPDPSPDGASLVYLAPDQGGQFVVRNLTTGEVRSLGVAGLAPRWSPDGHTIAYVCDFRICTIDANGGPPRQVSHADDFYSGEMLDWSPDGRWLLARGGEYLQLIELATGMTLRLGYAPDASFASWKPEP